MSQLVMPSAVVLCFATVSGALAAQSCKPIKFAPGRSSAMIRGTAQSNEHACYKLKTNAGQTATVKLLGRPKDDTAFNIDSLADNRYAYSFKTKAKTYKIDVYRTFPGGGPLPFTLAVSVR